MIFSKQPCYCPTCGKFDERNLSAPGWGMYCGKECREEWNWRETLSILGKEYYKEETNEPE